MDFVRRAAGMSSSRISRSSANAVEVIDVDNVTKESGRKRVREVPEIGDTKAGMDAGEGPWVNDDLADIPVSMVDLNIDLENVRMKALDRENAKFLALSVEIQNQLVRAVARLCLFRGTRKETLSRAIISDVLNKIDPDYKKHVSACLERAQKLLFEASGYMLLTAADIKGLKEGKKDDLYLVNTLMSTNKRRTLVSVLPDVNRAYFGFIFIVFHILLNASGHRMSINDLYREIRKLEPRFPETMNISTVRAENTTASAVEELEESFVSLINRMKKEHYIVLTKSSDAEADQNDSKSLVEYGPRFYLEVRNYYGINYLRSFFKPLSFAF